jgi:YHS domain-containing protein
MTPIDASRRIILVLAACGALASAAAGDEAARRLALKGYDPVSYFEDGRPIMGDARYSYPFDDAVYHFRSAAHRATFAAAPERYAPQYSAYCAGGVSKGYKAEPDPEAWLIANDKLYVFQFKDRVPEFRKRIAEVAAKADANWPAVKQQR